MIPGILSPGLKIDSSARSKFHFFTDFHLNETTQSLILQALTGIKLHAKFFLQIMDICPARPENAVINDIAL